MSEVASGVANVPARGALSRPGAAAVVRLAAPWLVLAVAFAVLPAIVTSGSALTMLSLMGIMIVFALSYNMLLGETGLLSFGHAVYYGLGGFLAVHAMNTVIHDALPVPLPTDSAGRRLSAVCSSASSSGRFRRGAPAPRSP